MSWNKVADRHEKKYGRTFISYEQNIISYDSSSERSFIIKTILKEFDIYNHGDVQLAVNFCCNHIIPPCPTDIFLKSVKILCDKYADKDNNQDFYK